MTNLTRSVWRTALFAASVTILASFGTQAAFGQDSSGDGLLKGSFRFRYVAVLGENTAGVVNEVTASQGVITFDGKGNYSIATGSQWVDNTKSGTQTIPAGSTGTYSINAAGIGSFSNPNPNPSLPGDTMWGTFAQGVIVASSTEEGYNSVYGTVLPATSDLFVAVAVGTTPTNATFTKPYWVGALDFAAGSDADLKNAMFEIAPNGSGGLGSLSIQGWANSVTGTAPLTQNVSGATYNFASDGNAQFSIPAPTGVSTPQVLVSGSRTVYVSNDGNFLLGWTPGGYDILFGVQALPSNTAGADSQYTGLYYTGGLGDWPTSQGTQNCGPYSYWGSQNADGNKNEVVHRRLYLPNCANFVDQNNYPLSDDFGTWNQTAITSTGSATDQPLDLILPALTYGFGDAGGNCVSGKTAACAFVAISNTPGEMALNIGVHTPVFSGTGLYLSPIGVVNAASWAPITSSVAPGELLTLFGSFGNVPTLISTGGQPFPNVLGPIQVNINGTQAPIYYVSSTQISVIAPFELANSTTYTAGIQVSNNGSLSNTVSVYLTPDANSGIFSYGPGGNGAQDGIGYAVAEHANGSIISDSNPAQPNETIVLALGGMGTVTPSITDGAVPSTSTLSYVDDFTGGYLQVYFHDFDNGILYQPATIQFAGLYPGLASLYQMNVTVPTTIGPGPDMFVEVVTPNGDSFQVQVPTGGTVNGTGPALSRRKAVVNFGQGTASPTLARPKPHLIPSRPRIQPKPAQQ